jgi:hypothetical protein
MFNTLESNFRREIKIVAVGAIKSAEKKKKFLHKLSNQFKFRFFLS